MKALKIVPSAILVLLLIGALIAPIGPVPGLFIGGSVTKAPEQWQDTSTVHEVMLRVPGTPPRVVIIWIIEYGGELHVVGSKESGWVTMIGSGSAVELRIGDNTYELNAAAVTSDRNPILEAYAAKYRPDYPDIVASLPSLDEAEDQVAVFRLERS